MTDQTAGTAGTAGTSETKVLRNAEKCRYEIWYGDELAGFSVYEENGNQTVFIHTEIGDAFGGKGLGSVLARHAVEDVIERGRAIVPLCPFIAAYLDKHPEYDAHVVGKGLAE